MWPLPDMETNNIHSNNSTITSDFKVTPGLLLGNEVSERELVELWEVDRVEQVLAPLCVLLTVVSNAVLLIHETRVVWLTRRLIPPKLLVLSLCAADLLATLAGFLPLWLYFVIPHDEAAPEPESTTQTVTTEAVEIVDVTEVPLGFKPFIPFTDSPPEPPGPGEESVDVDDTPSINPVVLSAGYAVTLFLLTTFWTLAQCVVVVMGIERFLALRAPFFYTARCSIRTFFIVIGAVTLASAGVAAFHLVVHLEEVQTDPIVFAGFLNSKSLAHNAFSLGQGVAWTVVLLLCNWAVTRELRRMERRVTVMRQKDQGEYLKQLSLVHGAGREFARFMMAVNIVFLLSSLPNLVCILLRLCQLAPSFAVQYFCWRMSHISALLNPFLYGFLRKSLRSRIRRVMTRHVKCLRSNQVEDVEPEPAVVRFNGRVSSATMPRDPEASTVQLE